MLTLNNIEFYTQYCYCNTQPKTEKDQFFLENIKYI